MPTINVYILTYNRSVYLKDAINSVLAQTYKEFNLYVLDNASQDDTQKVILSFNDERLHYIQHKKNIGGIENFNFAIDHCDAEYLVIFHDDDLMLPTFLQSEIEILKKYRTVDLVAGNASFFGGANGELKNVNGDICCYKAPDLFSQYLKRGNFLVFPSIMYRKAFLDEHSIRGNSLIGPANDVVIYFDVERCGGKIFEICKPIMKYRTHSGQDSAMNKYSMHVKLFHFLRTDANYCIQFNKERKGRIKRYREFSKLLFKDWNKGMIDNETADLYYRDLKTELMVPGSNGWQRLYNCCREHPRIKRDINVIHYRIKTCKKLLRRTNR